MLPLQNKTGIFWLFLEIFQKYDRKYFQKFLEFTCFLFWKILEYSRMLMKHANQGKIGQNLPAYSTNHRLGHKISFFQPFPAYYKMHISKLIQEILACSLKEVVIKVMYQFLAFSSIFQIFKIFSAFIPAFSGVYFMMVHSNDC